MSNSFKELKKWIDNRLGSAEMQAILIACGLTHIEAHFAVTSGLGSFWTALQVRVAFEEDNIDESVWMSYKLIYAEIVKYKKARNATLASSLAHSDFLAVPVAESDTDTEFVSKVDPQELGIKLVLVAITGLELEMGLQRLQPLPGRKAVIETIMKRYTVFIGLYKERVCALVQQPAVTAGGTQGMYELVEQAILFCNPEDVIKIDGWIDLLSERLK